MAKCTCGKLFNYVSLTVFRKYIVVPICDDEEYEKNVVFYIELGEPRLIRTAAGQ